MLLIAPCILPYILRSLFQPESGVISAKWGKSLVPWTLKIFSNGGNQNLVKFNASKTHLCSLSHKLSPNPHLLCMQNVVLLCMDSFFRVGVAFEKSWIWRSWFEKSRTDHFSRSFVPRVFERWNSLAESVFSAPTNLQNFKRRSKKFLLLYYLYHSFQNQNRCRRGYQNRLPVYLC